MTTTVDTPELTVVMPAYNEAENIGAVVESTTAYLGRRGIRYEIKIVDDGSRDGTFDVLARLQRDHPCLGIVRHARNRGYGSAIRSGLAVAKGTHILVSDGDGQFRIDDIEPLWRRRHLADMVLGYRDPRIDPLPRRIAGRAYNRLVRLFLGGDFRDVNCGFKLIARRAIEDVELRSTGALISAELLTRARVRGASFVEVAVPHFPRRHGSATGLLPRVVLRMIRELFMLRSSILDRASRPARRGLRTGCDAVESASA
jgi:glycosyltransferase involved in cell wall biosynthesis